MPYCDGGELFDAVALQRRFTEPQVMAQLHAAVYTLLVGLRCSKQRVLLCLYASVCIRL
jgi:hypothetical protein